MRKLVQCVFMMMLPGLACAQEKIRVGAKHFNEGYILGEMIALILEDGGFDVDRKFNLGGTAVAYQALANREIDVYPEYAGTISREILNQEEHLNLQAIRARVADAGLEISEPYGFNNTYALVMDSAVAAASSIQSISDLAAQPALRVGVSYEFLQRNDGWTNLARFYQLPQQPRGLEHGLAYRAVLEDQIDVTDAYSTDGEISRYPLLLLTDDRNFFPAYEAISFYSAKLPARAKDLLGKLNGAISAAEMQRLNAAALFEKRGHHAIAFEFLVKKGLISDSAPAGKAAYERILQKTGEHLVLTFVALVAAMFIAVPSGILIYRHAWLSGSILYVTGMLQTIPSIALLALMIPLLGIGVVPAIAALFLYALLPILRNTVIGLATVDPGITRVATAIGLSRWNRLRLVELPLALETILAGIRTAAVINIGTATLAAFIGAGGLGEFIVTGLALNSTDLILMGAIPAALLAIFMEVAFEGAAWFLLPRHLRRKITSR